MTMGEERALTRLVTADAHDMLLMQVKNSFQQQNTFEYGVVSR
jgi:hypothetical protein